MVPRVERQKINPRVGQTKNARVLTLIVKPFVISCDTDGGRLVGGARAQDYNTQCPKSKQALSKMSMI